MTEKNKNKKLTTRARNGKISVKHQVPSMQFSHTAFLPNPIQSMSHTARFEDEEESRLTLGQNPKKRSLQVYRDEGISPVGTESPLDEHRYVDHFEVVSPGVSHLIAFDNSFDFGGQNGLPSYSRNPNPSQFHVSPTPIPRPTLLPHSFKETPTRASLPQVSLHGLPTQHPVQSTQLTATSSASVVFPGQVLQDPAINPLFTGNYGWAPPRPWLTSTGQPLPRGRSPSPFIITDEQMEIAREANRAAGYIEIHTHESLRALGYGD